MVSTKSSAAGENMIPKIPRILEGPRRLEDLEEIEGTLCAVTPICKGIIQVQMGPVAILVPDGLKEELEKVVGCKISILYIDGVIRAAEWDGDYWKLMCMGRWE